mgnify:CR=1 FL=1
MSSSELVAAVQRPGKPLPRQTPAVPRPRTERPATRRAEAESGDVLPRYAEPADSQVLDRWKDSGKPIR